MEKANSPEYQQSRAILLGGKTAAGSMSTRKADVPLFDAVQMADQLIEEERNVSSQAVSIPLGNMLQQF